MVRCPNCGKDNPENQRLCFWCGTNLAEAEAPAGEVGKPEVPAKKPEPAPTAEKEILKAEKQLPPTGKYAPNAEFMEKRGLPWVKIMVVVLVITIVGIVVFFLTSGGEGLNEGGSTGVNIETEARKAKDFVINHIKDEHIPEIANVSSWSENKISEDYYRYTGDGWTIKIEWSSSYYFSAEVEHPAGWVGNVWIQADWDGTVNTSTGYVSGTGSFTRVTQ